MVDFVEEANSKELSELKKEVESQGDSLEIIKITEVKK